MKGIADIIALAFGGCGVLFGLACYGHLLRWVRRARGSRIVVAYKRRVVLDAPMTEWMNWAYALEKDTATGRVVYRGSHVSVAIARPGAGQKKAEVVKQT